MKKMKVVGLVVGLIGILGVGNAMSATKSAQILVNASVSAACSITVDSNISFGALDPLTATAPINAATPGQVTVKCTNGATVDFSSASYAAMTGATNGDTIDYVPVLPANGSEPGFTGTPYTISASITATEIGTLQAASVDTYVGSFDVQIDY